MQDMGFKLKSGAQLSHALCWLGALAGLIAASVEISMLGLA
jgi:hypothetical protein